MSDLFDGNPTQQAAQAPQEPAPAPQPAAPTAEPSPIADPFAHQLASIVAEDGRQKYADVSTALASIPHAQTKIRELSEQLSQAQEEITKRKGMEDMLAQLQASQAPVAETPSVQGLDEQAISQLIQSQLTQSEAAKIAEQNRLKVKDALVSAFGDKAQEVFAARAEELGIPADTLAEQAKSHPDFVLAQFAGTKVSNAQPVKSSVQPTAITPQPAAFKPVMRGATMKSVVDAYKQIEQRVINNN